MSTDLLIDVDKMRSQEIDAVTVPWRTPMQHRIWLETCAKVFEPNSELVAIKASNEPFASVGIFTKERNFPGRLVLAGAEQPGEPTDLIIRNQSEANDLALNFKRTGRAGRFGYIPANSMFIPALKNAFGASGLISTAPYDGSPYIKLSEAWRDPLSQFSSRYRSDFRRMRRRAEALGAVTIEILSPAPEDVDALLDEAIAIEAKGWKSRAGSSLALNERTAVFFKEYGKRAAEEGIFRIAFLRIDGTAIAMQIAAECDDAFWLFKIGYDETYHKCSPGNLLMLGTVEYSAEKGLASYEFLGRAAAWTRVWTKDERHRSRLRVYPYTLRGLSALAIDGAQIGLKRISSKLRGRNTPAE